MSEHDRDTRETLFFEVNMLPVQKRGKYVITVNTWADIVFKCIKIKEYRFESFDRDHHV